MLFEGVVVFFGSPEYLNHYFRLENPDDVFARLGTRRADQWRASWAKHGPQFAALMGDDLAVEDEAASTETGTGAAAGTPAESEEEAEAAPGPFADLIAANQAYEAAHAQPTRTRRSRRRAAVRRAHRRPADLRFYRRDADFGRRTRRPGTGGPRGGRR